MTSPTNATTTASAAEIRRISPGLSPLLAGLVPLLSLPELGELGDLFLSAGVHSLCSGNPHNSGFPRNAVGPWFANEPVWGISPERLFLRRSKLTVIGRFPSDLGISPDNLLSDKFNVPDKDCNSPKSSGIGPVSSFEDKSSCTRFARDGQMLAGIAPENRFFARISRCSCLHSLRLLGISPERELSDTSRFCSLGIEQMEVGIGPERLLL
uniref:Uncharacterized protein n=1 Tax=Opuntia streptacantha TaxID=393608 RepID=A0A7C9A7P3_OPUST